MKKNSKKKLLKYFKNCLKSNVIDESNVAFLDRSDSKCDVLNYYELKIFFEISFYIYLALISF